MATTEHSRSFQNGKSRFENISGQYRPGKGSLFEEIMTPASSEIRDSYWTEHTIGTVTEVMQALHTELAPYGVPPNAVFDKTQFRILGEKATKKVLLGNSHTHSGLVFLSQRIWNYLEEKDNLFVLNYAREVLAHEYAHTLSARVLRNSRLRRQGIEMFLAARNETKAGPDIGPIGILVRPVFKVAVKAEGMVLGFDKFSEGVVEITSQRIVEKYFPSPLGISRSSSHDRYVELIDKICKRVSDINPRYGSPENVYRLFEQAEFGNGRLLPLARAIESTYGKGSFTQIMTALESLPRFNEGRFYKYEEFYPVLEGKASLEEYVKQVRF